MASPPFNPNEALPEDDDVAAAFPGVERTFRDVMESWVLTEHGRSGHHTLPSLTTSERDAITNWEVGSVLYNETLGKFQYVTAIDSDVFLSIGPEFPAGTRLAFQQTTPPTGWTKVTDAAYNNVAFRLVTGSVSSGGSEDFTTAFASRTPTGTVGATTLTASQIPELSGQVLAGDGAGAGATIAANSRGFAGNSGNTGFVSNSGLIKVNNSGGGGSHTHTWTGDALSFAVKYRDFVLAEKA